NITITPTLATTLPVVSQAHAALMPRSKASGSRGTAGATRAAAGSSDGAGPRRGGGVTTGATATGGGGGGGGAASPPGAPAAAAGAVAGPGGAADFGAHSSVSRRRARSSIRPFCWIQPPNRNPVTAPVKSH